MVPRGSRLLTPFTKAPCRWIPAAFSPPITNQYTQTRGLSYGTRQAKNAPPGFGFAFEYVYQQSSLWERLTWLQRSIDGVLLRSAAPIPGAAESLTYLRNNRIPFILLTNGGGKRESARVSEISDSLRLPTPLTTDNFVQSHTPFADFLQQSSSGQGIDCSATVLVVGGEASKCRDVAEQYGYQNVITPGDIFAAYPEIWPISSVFSSYYRSFAKPLPRPINPAEPTASLKIDVVFVFNDPRDWALDTQVLVDILLSKEGVLGTVSTKNGDKSLPNSGFQQDGQPPLYFSNPDLLWAAKYHLPRLGQGGFQHALEGVWQRLTNGSELRSTIIGKPSTFTYTFAEKKLRSYHQDLFHQNTVNEQQSSHQQLPPLQKIYMVGDNPESDIMGANNFRSTHGTEWVSVLVKTGVYNQQSRTRYDFDARPELKPQAVMDDVETAINWALKDSQWDGRGID